MQILLVLAALFVSKQEDLAPYLHKDNVLMMASPGRSGSTMLTEVLEREAPQYKVIKTHLLPPSKNFTGKVIFIYSNPDLAAESALHMCMDKSWARSHFRHVESSDRPWLKRLKSEQTKKVNLLMYDALGCTRQLAEWLGNKAQVVEERNARILAIKYEHLWDPETQEKIKNFLGLAQLSLPEKRIRGADKLSQEEREMRKKYNLGTIDMPKYAAYNRARDIWERAPAYQFLNFKD